MGAAVPIVGMAIGLGLGAYGAYQGKRQADSMKDAYKEDEQRRLALESRAAKNEKRAQALNDANLLRQRQRALAASSLPKQGTLMTGASGVLGSAPTAGKSALGT